tara:strand:+ start:269 stop:577 length:309 start_codon:yes stop_codon:yes gene_type:complete
MNLLNIVNKSPFERSVLESCLRLAQPGAAILLIEDGVYAALKNTTKSKMIKNCQTQLQFYALHADLEMRGILAPNIIERVKIIDYGGFVDLVEEYDSVHSWL